MITRVSTFYAIFWLARLSSHFVACSVPQYKNAKKNQNKLKSAIMTDAPSNCCSKTALAQKPFVNALILITDIANEIPINMKAVPIINRSCQFLK
jgi:hypothetical protein